MKRPLLVLPLVLLGVAGCGSSDAAPEVDESDKPGTALACLDDQGIPARLAGKDQNEVVLDAGPRIKFYLTPAEAEAAQFQGHGEGAEQIGSALLFLDPEIDDRTEELLKNVEGCLQDL